MINVHVIFCKKVLEISMSRAFNHYFVMPRVGANDLGGPLPTSIGACWKNAKSGWKPLRPDVSGMLGLATPYFAICPSAPSRFRITLIFFVFFFFCFYFFFVFSIYIEFYLGDLGIPYFTMFEVCNFTWGYLLHLE